MSKPGMKPQNTGSNNKPNQGANTTPNSNTASFHRPQPSPLQSQSANSEDLAVINDLAKKATPKQMMVWIDRLQELYEQKKTNVRKDLTDKVSDLLEANGYTMEELFGARQLPSTADLAARSKSKENGKARLM